MRAPTSTKRSIPYVRYGDFFLGWTFIALFVFGCGGIGLTVCALLSFRLLLRLIIKNDAAVRVFRHG
jgi:hypothetical protein